MEHEIILSLLATLKHHLPSAKRLGLLVASPFEEMALRAYAFGDECEVIESIEATVQVCVTNLHAYDRQ